MKSANGPYTAHLTLSRDQTHTLQFASAELSQLILGQEPTLLTFLARHISRPIPQRALQGG